MSLITANDTVQEMMLKMAQGNLGALSVVAQLLKETAAIDPDAILEGLSAILALDTNEIYGESIWVLYKYGCGENLVKLIAALRAKQFGLIDRFALYSASNISPKVVPIRADIVEIVQAKLPNFGKAVSK